MTCQILLVEDHLVMRRAYVQLIARDPNLELVGMAASAEDALAVLEEKTIDLLVTDLVLPGMDGAELIERARTFNPSLRAIVVSGYDDELFKQRARQAGAGAYVNKRDASRVLLETINRVIRGEPYDYTET